MQATEKAKQVKKNPKLQNLTLVFVARRYNTVNVQGIDSPEAKAELEKMGFETWDNQGVWKAEKINPRIPPSKEQMARVDELRRTQTGGPEHGL